MGCDIHPLIEVRRPVSYNRDDAEVRALQRAVSEGDPDAEQRLREITNYGPWELGCVERYPHALSDVEDAENRESEYASAYRALYEWWQRPENVEKTSTGEGRWAKDIWRCDPELELPPFNRDRDYVLFAWLTGSVRNYDGIEGIVDDPRGVPHDASEFWRLELDFEGPDAHSESWATADEILKTKPPAEYAGGIVALKAVMKKWVEAYGRENVRACFHFDN